jgi:hypothetical protein
MSMLRNSPFVSTLITKCFTTANKTEYQVLKDYRKELLANKKTIEVTDFGGSKSSHQTKEKSLGLQ